MRCIAALAGKPVVGYLPASITWGLVKVNRARLVRYSLYVGAAAIVAAPAVWLEWQAISDLWFRALGWAEANWHRAFIGGGRLLTYYLVFMAIEVLFLNWEKTTIFIVLVRRKLSAMTDVLGVIVSFTPGLKTAREYGFTLGLAFVAVKLGDVAADGLGWYRWELPTEGVLAVSGGFVVYYLISTFVQYWLHRLQHWRWFWQLHRLHHSATEFNLLTGFRVNPAEGVTNVLLIVSPTIFLKIPDAGLFAAYMFRLSADLDGAAQPASLELRMGRPVDHGVSAEPSDPSFDRRRAPRKEFLRLSGLGPHVRHLVRRREAAVGLRNCGPGIGRAAAVAMRPRLLEFLPRHRARLLRHHAVGARAAEEPAIIIAEGD